MKLTIKRVYEAPSAGDGRRVLVDRLWPRGLTREAARIDAWMKDLSPSNDLRRWIHADPARWDEFLDRYRAELATPGLQARLAELRALAAAGPVTLLHAAKDTVRNNAVALKRILEQDPQGRG